MTIPTPTHPCWLRLANGGLARLKTQHLGTQLMTKRIERSADSPLQKSAEIRAFFEKWERVLQNENAIFLTQVENPIVGDPRKPESPGWRKQAAIGWNRHS